MKFLIITMSLIIPNLSFSQMPLNCEELRSLANKGSVELLNFDCETNDTECKILEKEQITYALTGYFNDAPVTQVSEDVFKELNQQADGAYKIQLKLGDIILDGVNLGLGAGDTTLILFFALGKTQFSPLSIYSGEFAINDQSCGFLDENFDGLESPN